MRKIKITTRGCPWQDIEQSPFYNFPKGKYGWNPFSVKGWGRYGGNWAIKFGIDIGSQRTSIHFGLGTVTISYLKNEAAPVRKVNITAPQQAQATIESQKQHKIQMRADKADKAITARDALAAEGFHWVEFNDGMHLRVNGRYDFYPTTGLYIHCKTGVRGRGVRGLIRAINKDEL